MSEDIKSSLRSLQRINKGVVSRGEFSEDVVTTEAIWHQLVESGENGEKRLILILNSRGCSFALKNVGPCFNCGLVTASNQGAALTTEEVARQFDAITGRYDFQQENITELDLFNAGSMLDDWQVPTEMRGMLFQRISKLDTVNKVLIDSRPEDITREKIASLRSTLGNTQLWVGIGFETASDEIRNLCINKDFLLSDFEKAVDILAEENANLFTYLMFKPAFITEHEAIEDIKQTTEYLSRLSAAKNIPLQISLEPGVVQGDCLLTHLYTKGLYSTPWLWSVIRTVKESYHHTDGRLRIGIPEEVPKVLDRRRNYGPDNSTCSCSSIIEKSIIEYNTTRSLTAFSDLPECSCQKQWARQLEEEKASSHIPLRKRVSSIKSKLEKSDTANTTRQSDAGQG